MLEPLSAAAASFVFAYGALGTFLLAFMESFFFPIPTAVLIFPAALTGLDPLVVVLAATLGSVLGAAVGYWLGRKYGKRVADRFFAAHLPSIESWYEKYGVGVVFIAAFTPVPFKVITWFSGICRMSFWKFLLVSVPGRLLQFLLVAYLGTWAGGLF